MTTTEHQAAADKTNLGETYCGECGLIKRHWEGQPCSAVLATAKLTEAEKFIADPLAWQAEWVETNGKIEVSHLPGRFSVALYVEDRPYPLSTGQAPTLPHAFRNAITGLTPFMR